MFDVPGKTIRPSFADADEEGTMDFVSHGSVSETYARQRDPVFGDTPASEKFTSKCFDAAHQDYENSLKQAQALNSAGFLQEANDFLLNILDLGVPNLSSPGFYDFTSTGQHAYQFGEPTEPAFKWFWHLSGRKINCRENGKECVSINGFRKATSNILPFELSLWGHLQGKGDPVERDTCWKPSDPVLLGELVIDKNEEPKTCEHARFNPWHAPIEHRPLGSVGRARGPVYRNRQEARGALPCSSLDECRQNGEKRYSAPSVSWFVAGPTLRAVSRVLPLLIRHKVLGGGRQSDHSGEEWIFSRMVWSFVCPEVSETDLKCGLWYGRCNSIRTPFCNMWNRCQTSPPKWLEKKRYHHFCKSTQATSIPGNLQNEHSRKCLDTWNGKIQSWECHTG